MPGTHSPVYAFRYRLHDGPARRESEALVRSTDLHTLHMAATIAAGVVSGALAARFAVKHQWWSAGGMAVLGGAGMVNILIASNSRSSLWWFAVVIAGLIAAAILSHVGYARDERSPRNQ
jgi:hypothetical protein